MTRLLLAVCLTLGLSAPLWASEEIGRQEDTPSGTGHVLMPEGCVRQDTIAASTDADGDYTHVKCNNVGRLYGTVAIDTALPAGTNAIGKLSPNSGVIIGDVNLVSPIPAGGNAIGTVAITSDVPGTGATNSGKAEGNAHVNADTGMFPLAVRHDTSTTGLGADGTYAAFGLNSLGELYTQSNTEMPAAVSLADNTANPTVPGVAAFMMCFDGTSWDRCLPGLSDTDDNSVAFSQVTSLVIGATHVSDGTSWVRMRTYIEDVAASGHDGGQLLIVGGVRQDTAASSTSTDGDYSNFKMDSAGRLHVNCGVGCAAGATTPTDSFANPTTAALNMTFNTGWNGATWDRLQVDASKFLKVNCAAGCGAGATTPTDAFANPTTANLNMTFNTGWNGASWDRLQVDASKFLKINCATGCAGGATTPTDAFANPTTAGLQMTFPTGWNGASWDRLQVDGSKFLKTVVSAALPAGGNTIGTVNVGTFPGTGTEDSAATDGGTLIMAGTHRKDVLASSASTTGENANFITNSFGALFTQATAGPSGGSTPCYITSAASTNATSCKGSAGTLYSVSAVNTTATLYYLRLYNTAAAPTCSSATGFIETIPVPAATTGAGYVRDISVGDAYGTGIGFCLTGGGSSTDNTNAATGVYLSLHYN